MTGSTILNVTYGIEAEDDNDPWIALNENFTRDMMALGTVGSHTADMFPICTKTFYLWINFSAETVTSDKATCEDFRERIRKDNESNEKICG